MGSHFVHAAEQVARRVLEAKCVRNLVRLAKPSEGTTAVLWAGDLNFRVTDFDASEFANVVQNHPKARMKDLVEKNDQMAQLDKDGVLNFVDEAPIQFIPTYRYVVGFKNCCGSTFIQFRLAPKMSTTCYEFHLGPIAFYSTISAQ